MKIHYQRDFTGRDVRVSFIDRIVTCYHAFNLSLGKASVNGTLRLVYFLYKLVQRNDNENCIYDVDVWTKWLNHFSQF